MYYYCYVCKISIQSIDKSIMFKKILCAVALLFLCELSRAYYVQLEQITTTQGLNHPEVTVLEYQNPGYLLIGTQTGFCDILNGNIIPTRTLAIDGESCAIGRINDIKTISSYRALVASEYFIFQYDLHKRMYDILRYNEKNLITKSLVIDESEAFFYCASENSLFKYNIVSHKVSEIYKFDKKCDYTFEKILISRENGILLLCDRHEGIFSYNISSGIIEHIDRPYKEIIAKASYIDSENNLWTVLEDGRLFRNDINADFVETGSYKLKNNKQEGIEINCLVEQPDGNMIVATRKDGIILLDKTTGNMSFFNNDFINEVSSLCMIENNVVMGTIYNGVIIARRSYYYTMNGWSLSDNALSGEMALSAFDEGNGTIWIGTAGHGINKYDELKDRTYYYPKTEGLSIKQISRYDKNRLLIGTYSDGYFLFDTKTGNIDNSFLESLFAGCKIDIKSGGNSILIIPCKDDKYLIFNSENGHYLYNPLTGEKSYFNTCVNKETGMSELVRKVIIRDSYVITIGKRTIDELSIESLSNNNIYTSNRDYTDCVIDKNENIWFSDFNVLLKYDRKENQIVQKMKTASGSEIKSMVYDESGLIWLSSESGYVYSYNEDLNSFILYNKEDGITHNTFLRAFSLLSSKGRLYIPRVDGLLVLDTHEIIQRESAKNRVSCFSVCIDGEYKDKKEIEHLRIRNKYKSFEIILSLGGNDPTSPVDYQICLEKNGKIGSFINSNKVIWDEYMNNSIGAGNYNLLIRDLNNDGWSEPYSILKFKIKAPFWLSWPFNCALLLLIFIIIALIVYTKNRNKIMNLEKRYNEELILNKESRVRFITDIAHELRTPLSLVYNPFKDMILENIFDNSNRAVADRILHQLNKMKKMIDMILDSSSVADMSICDRLEKTDINEWVKQLLEPFYADCDRKGLTLIFVPCNDSIIITIDKDILEIVINNLLTNAIKYSDSGTITLTITSSNNRIMISVADQGKGFKCDPESLFVRGFREDCIDRNGFGLGLNLAYTQIKKIGGTIRAEKNIDKGSIFTIDFPIYNIIESFSLTKYVDEMSKEEAEEKDHNGEYSSEHIDFCTSQMTLLFVDNDCDMCDYIKETFKTKFKTIYVAKDGRFALDIIKEKLPDIVLSDINMPDMNGFDLCKAIKSNIELSHIPIILLTTRTHPQVRTIGYKLGADGFLSKPFDIDEMYRLIQSKLWNRFEIKKQYSQSFFSAISVDQTFSAVDEKFVLDLNSFIKDNISNQNLSVEMIYEHMNVSRSTLFNKMNDLLGTSTAKYIRGIRIGLAKELLAKTEKSVLDIALECGFADGQYLSSVFRQETGETPTQYRKNAKLAKS